MEDSSLDEFVDEGGSESGEDPSESGTSASESGDGDSRDDRIEQATTTSRWQVGGTECQVCGERSRRLWNDDGQFVCQSCKEW